MSLARDRAGGVTAGMPDTTTEARARQRQQCDADAHPGRASGHGPENQRRRGPLLGQVQGQRLLGDTPVAPHHDVRAAAARAARPAGADPRQQSRA
ncbi:hypothetical protein LV779_30495 [Streptomyces thinghirensis]|nr:hypothetical protein [Streptomyces thinghirensis]